MKDKHFKTGTSGINEEKQLVQYIYKEGFQQQAITTKD